MLAIICLNLNSPWRHPLLQLNIIRHLLNRFRLRGSCYRPSQTIIVITIRRKITCTNMIYINFNIMYLFQPDAITIWCQINLNIIIINTISFQHNKKGYPININLPQLTRGLNQVINPEVETLVPLWPIQSLIHIQGNKSSRGGGPMK